MTKYFEHEKHRLVETTGAIRGTCEVRDMPHSRTAHLTFWRTGNRAALNELRDALSAT